MNVSELDSLPVICRETQIYSFGANLRDATMELDLSADSVLDTIEKAVVEDLLTFTREIPTGLYFPDCEMCDPADRPPTPDPSSRLEASLMWGHSEESQVSPLESKIDLSDLTKILPSETPRRSIAPVRTWIKMDLGSPEIMTGTGSPPEKRARKSPSSARRRKAAKRSRQRTSVAGDRASNAINATAKLVNKVSNKSQFLCELCQRDFRRPADLRRHVDGVHLDIRPFACEVCPKRFKRAEGLRFHKCSGPSEVETQNSANKEESKAMAVIEKPKSTPAVKESKSTPVPEKSKTMLIAQTSDLTQSRKRCRDCNLRSKRAPRDCQRKHLFTRRENKRFVCVSCKVTVWTPSPDKDEPLCDRPHRCPCGRCYNTRRSFRRHFIGCWRRQKKPGNKLCPRLGHPRRSDQDTQSEIESEASA